MLQIDPKEISVQKLHQYLLGAIGPRPIALASTVDKEGHPNLAPFSFFNVFSANPPILIFSPARSGRLNTTKDTYKNCKSVPEVVINVVNFDIVEQVSLASSPYDSEIDEFIKSGLTPIKSDKVKPFRVKESPVQFECKVNKIVELGEEGGAGNLIICEVIQLHIDESILNADGMIDSTKIDLVSRMGGDWYCRADINSMFEIKKPITTCGIGYDNIPKDIQNSDYFDKNELARLAGIEVLPDETEVNEYKLMALSDIFISHSEDANLLEKELHKRARGLLKDNKLNEAWLTLLSFNN